MKTDGYKVSELQEKGGHGKDYGFGPTPQVLEEEHVAYIESKRTKTIISNQTTVLITHQQSLSNCSILLRFSRTITPPRSR